MEAILDDVRKDAIGKLRASTGEEKKELTDAAFLIMGLSMVASEEGLLSLEDVVEEEQFGINRYLRSTPQVLLAVPAKSSYLKRVIMLIVDGTSPEKVARIGVSAYWTQNPQGVMAMVYYIYIYGTICIQRGDHSTAMYRILQSLLPEECYPAFEESAIALMEMWDKERRENDMAWEEEKKLLRKEIAEQILHFHPVIKNPELRKAISALEEEVLVKLPSSSLGKVLKACDYDCIRNYLYGFGDKARQRILDTYFQSQYSKDEKDEIMGEVIKKGERPEDEVLGSVLIMTGVIKRLRCLGEI